MKPKVEAKKSKERSAIELIARMGHGMKESIIDWSAIGKKAVHLAKQVEAGECECCGRAKAWEANKQAGSGR